MNVCPGVSDAGAVVVTVATAATVLPDAVQASVIGCDVYVVVAAPAEAGTPNIASAPMPMANRTPRRARDVSRFNRKGDPPCLRKTAASLDP